MLGNKAAVASLALALAAPAVFPFFNTILTAPIAILACGLGFLAIMAGARANYRLAAVAGIIVSGLIVLVWILIMALALSAATGSPL